MNSTMAGRGGGERAAAGRGDGGGGGEEEALLRGLSGRGLIPSSCEDDKAVTDAFCTGRCTANFIIFFFLYASAVAACAALSKCSSWSLALTVFLPPAALLLLLFHAFGHDVPPLQAAYVGASTLAVAAPLCILLPMVRTGWGMVVRLLDLATWNSSGFLMIRPGFALWSFVDAFVLEATLQELIKVATVYKVMQRGLIRRPGQLLLYSAVASTMIAMVELGVHAWRLAGSLKSFEMRNMSLSAIRDGEELPGLRDHVAGVRWSFVLYHAGFLVPMQLATGFVVACLSARRTLLGEKVSFLQVALWPVMFHGLPLFASQMLRHISHNEAWRVLHGADPADLDKQRLGQLAAFTALLQFVTCAILATALISALILCRILFMKVSKAWYNIRMPTSVSKPGFLFSWNDVLLRTRRTR